MAINGNDLPSSLADKHALEAATSVSELLILNKLGVDVHNCELCVLQIYLLCSWCFQTLAAVG